MVPIVRPTWTQISLIGFFPLNSKLEMAVPSVGACMSSVVNIKEVSVQQFMYCINGVSNSSPAVIIIYKKKLNS